MVATDIFLSFKDVPNFLYGLKICIAGRLIQHPDSSSTVCMYVVLHFPAEIHKTFPEIDIVWRGTYAALKSVYAFQRS